MKVRIYQLSRDLRISSDALVNMVTALGVEVKGHMSSIDEEIVVQIKAKIAQEREVVRKEDERKAQFHEDLKLKEEAARRRPPAAPVRVAPPEPIMQPAPTIRMAPPTMAPAPATARAPEKTAAPGAWRPATPPVIGGGRKDTRKRKKGRTPVDEKVVRDNVRRTLATLETGRRKRRRRGGRGESGAETPDEAVPVKVTEFMTVSEFASVLEASPTEVVGACLQMGIIANVNRRLDKDEMGAIADEFGAELEFVHEYGEKTIEDTMAAAEGTFESSPRPPVVTVMGHVDHGKTSLLDYIRKTKVVAGESGGITQHIGAYSVSLPTGRVTFLDTPGHEAFTAMRARGAQVTDIVVLVVAGDDRVMPQTLEAINHARAASVPIVVAITKIDLPGANSEKIKAQLAEAGVLVEQYGGKTVCVEVSSKKGDGIDQLLEMILLQAEILELKAEPDRPAQGVIIESKLDPGKGVVGTVLVQNGTLKVGDPFVCGLQHGKVRVMVRDTGARVTDVGPSTPVEVWGWSGLPQAGDSFRATRSEQDARDIASKRSQIHREQEMRLSRRRTLLDISQRIKQGEVLGLNLVLKGDVAGSVEVIRDSLEKLSTPEVQVRVIHQGVGAITEGDVLLAAASEAIVVGFHVKPDAKAQAAIQTEKVDVRLYTVIYEVVDEVRSAMSGLLAPDLVEKIQATVEVRKIFRVSRVGVVAGCMVTDGTIHRSDSVRILRDGEKVWEGKIASLKRIKDDAREVAAGFECGIQLEGRDDVLEGDVIQAYIVEEIARKLE
jgi:translation initiation factor IF-2